MAGRAFMFFGRLLGIRMGVGGSIVIKGFDVSLSVGKIYQC